jgi:hypothetical protein
VASEIDQCLGKSDARADAIKDGTEHSNKPHGETLRNGIYNHKSHTFIIWLPERCISWRRNEVEA